MTPSELESGQIFKEDWETGSNGWTITSTNADVKWQLDGSNTNWEPMRCTAVLCPTTATTGQPSRASSATSTCRPVMQSHGAVRFARSAETGSCTYDVTSVWVNGTMAAQLCSNITNFTESVYDLTPTQVRRSRWRYASIPRTALRTMARVFGSMTSRSLPRAQKGAMTMHNAKAEKAV